MQKTERKPDLTPQGLKCKHSGINQPSSTNSSNTGDKVGKNRPI